MNTVVKPFYRCYLGLGSNISNALGDPIWHIQQAYQRLSEHEHVCYTRRSSLYQSVPMGPQDQPEFINAVVEIDTNLAPINLLALCQNLERQAQRVRKRHWGERSLDVDILLYADQVIQLPQLTLPHVGLYERNFVLIPLKELQPELQINGVSIEKLAMSHDWSGLQKLA